MLIEQFKTGFQVSTVSSGQFKVKDQTTQGNQKMQTVTKDSLLFGNRFPKAGIISQPISARARHQVKLNDRNRQAINNALPIQTQIQAMQ
jgi:hypothetical protein